MLYPMGRHLAVHNFTADSFDGGEYMEQNTGFLLREPRKTKRRDEDDEGKKGNGVKRKGKRPGGDHFDDEDSVMTAFCLHPQERHLAIAESSKHHHSILISVIEVRGAGQGDKLLCSLKNMKSKTLHVSKSHVQDKEGTMDEKKPSKTAAASQPTDSEDASRKEHEIKPLRVGAFNNITIMVFSADGRYLAMIGDGPTHPLAIWEWSTHPRLMGMPRGIGAEVTSLEYNPHNNSELITCGPKILCKWSIGFAKNTVEKEFTHHSILTVQENETLKDFCYFKSRKDLIAVCKSGQTVNEILLISKGEILHRVDISGLTAEVNCIASIKDGFAVGCLGKLLYYQFRTNDTIKFNNDGKEVEETSLFQRKYHIYHSTEDNKKTAQSVFLAKCIHMSRPLPGKKDCVEPLRPKEIVLSPTSEILAVVSQEKEVFTLYLEAMELLEQEEAQQHMTFIKTGLHKFRITGMDVCTEQPLFITCSDVDYSVRLWNYAEQQCIGVKIFDEPPTSVSIQNSGFELAVSFQTKILFFRITIDELVLRGEVAHKNFHKVKYSNGGQWLAAASARAVLVFSARSLKTVAKFKGNQERVTSMAWSGNDTCLTTVGVGGGVYRWNIEQNSRVLEFMSDNLGYSSVILSHPNNIMAVAGYQKTGSDRRFTLQFHVDHNPSVFGGHEEYTHYNDPSDEEALQKGKRRDKKEPSGLIEQLTHVDLHLPSICEPDVSPSNSPLHRKRSLDPTSAHMMGNKSHQCYSPNSSEYVPNLQLALICMGRQEFLLVGTQKGSIMAYAWPLRQNSECLKEFHVHTDAVSSLTACQKTGVIISASLDGSLFVFSLDLVHHKPSADDILAGRTGVPKLKEIKELIAARERGEDTDQVINVSGPFQVSSYVSTPFFKPLFKPFVEGVVMQARLQLQKEIEEQKMQDRALMRKVREFFGQRKLEPDNFGYVMVKKKDYREKQTLIKNLVRQAKMYEMEWEYKMRRDMDGIKKKLILQKQEFERQLINSTQKQKMLQQKDKAREAELKEWLEHVETQHVLAAEALERLYERKLALEAKRYRNLTEKANDQETGLSLELRLYQQQQEEKMKTMEEEYQQELTDCKHKIGKLEQKQADDGLRYVEFLEEMDAEHDMEITKEIAKSKNDAESFNSEIEKIVQRNTILKGQLVHQKQKMKNEIRKQEKKMEEMKEIEVERTKAQAEVAKLRQKDREATAEHKKQQQRLLKSQAEIIKLTDQNESLTNQVQAFLEEKKLNNVEGTKLEIENRIRSLDAEFHDKTVKLRLAERALKENKSRINNLTNQLNNALKVSADKEIQLGGIKEDIMVLKDIGTLRDKYCSREKKKHIDARVENEFIRQTKQYKRTIAFLQQKVSKLDYLIKGAQGRRLNDNIGLMKEINDLRIINKDFKAEISALKSELGNYKIRQLVEPGKHTPRKERKEQVVAMPKLFKDGDPSFNHLSGEEQKTTSDAYAEMEKMLKASYRRLGQQEEELQSLRAQVSTMASREEANKIKGTAQNILPPPDFESKVIFDHLSRHENGDVVQRPTPPIIRMEHRESAMSPTHVHPGRPNVRGGKVFTRRTGHKKGPAGLRNGRPYTAREPQTSRAPPYQVKRPMSRPNVRGKSGAETERKERFEFVDRAHERRNNLTELFDRFDDMGQGM